MNQKSRFLEVHEVLSMNNPCATNSEQTNGQLSKTEPEQVGGTHYTSMAIQPIDFIMKNGLSFAEGNVVKYVWLYRKKGGKADLLKARQYIDFLLQQHYPESGK